MTKPKVALYWAASCGGCEIAVLDIGERLLDLTRAVDIVFWPAAIDIKYSDVEAMEDEEIDLCLFNGAIRTSDNAQMARLLRKKSKLLVAYGSCAHEGCIPGLANTKTRKAILERTYVSTESTENPEGILPQPSVQVEEGELTLPEFYHTVRTLDQVVDVDYYVPGCPPEADQTWKVLSAFLEGDLPEKGRVVGASEKIVCEECPLTKEEKKISEFKRPLEVIPEPEKCLLEQGVFCAGIATRAGCGALCPGVGMPCRGCYGPPPGISDQGAKIVSALGSVIDAVDPDEVQRIVAQIPNPIGLFYRFSLAHSILQRTTTDDYKD
jgi:F420-non-reducing hydrogenase small subunit